MDLERVIDQGQDRITDHPRVVIGAFLVVTVLFTTGLSAVETEGGQEQFIEDLPAFQALEDIERDFGASFTEPTTSTTVIQVGQNVLAKPELLRMLQAQERFTGQDALRVTSTSSPARLVAQTLDPNATTIDQQRRAVERATHREIAAAVRTTADRNPGFTNQLSADFNRREASASAAQATVTHGTDRLPPQREERMERLTASVGGDLRVIGTPPDTITDSLILVIPASLVFIVLFLIVAYRDPVDLLLGLVAILVTLVWTFGFLGLVGIPFNPLLVAVPPLLIAVGIDFGIHSVNRYREERIRGHDIGQSMRLTTDQLGVAFFIVAGTTVIGFLSNLVSAFPPIRDFGLTAAIGILFTFLIFGVFLPAMKVSADRIRSRYAFSVGSDAPLGAAETTLGRVLGGGVTIAERAPVIFLVAIVLTTAGVGAYATGVETGFDPDDFLPPEETPKYLQSVPEPFRPPAEYEYVANDNLRNRKFAQDEQVLLYIEGPMERDTALESLNRAGTNPPETFRRTGRQARGQSIITVIRSQAQADPAFRRLVERNDRNDNGIPDDNLGAIYDELQASSAGGQVDGFLGESRRSTRVVYTVDGTANDEAVADDAYRVADKVRFQATPTGTPLIFEEATNLLFASVVQSLLITLAGASVFLVVIYWVLEGQPSLGLANIVPIVVAVTYVVASMRLFDIEFNAINGTILALTIGLGIDYSVHVVHRFADELHDRDIEPALRRTMVGTGGALTGSMLTTVFGVGVLVLALNPAIGVFGLLTALSVVYAYIASLFVTPSVLVVWASITGAANPVPSDG